MRINILESSFFMIHLVDCVFEIYIGSILRKRDLVRFREVCGHINNINTTT